MNLSDFKSIFSLQLINLAKGCLHKEAEDLTEDEKCALAWCCGIEMIWGEPVSTPTSMKFRMTTKNPIGVVKIDGKFRVYESVDKKGDTLYSPRSPS